MTPQRAKELLPIITAFAEGKTIQYLNTSNEWEADEDLNFGSTPFRYRIKPEPKLRPWKPGEVPLGAIIRSKSNPQNWAMVTGCLDGKVKIGIVGFDCDADFSNPHLSCEHSIDGGKQWLPCGVEE